MRKKIMTLMMGMLLLLTACGQTGGSSASAMLPVAAVQSAAQGVAGVADKTADKAEIPQKEEKTEGSADTPLPVERAETSENADAEAEKQPTTAETAPPTTPEQAATPAPVPEDKPAPAPTPAPAQNPAEEKQKEEPASTPKPESELKPEPADRWAAVEAANDYAAAQYGVITDGSLTLDNSAYRFPASVAADASQEVLEAKARDMVDYTFRQLMMQAGMDGFDSSERSNAVLSAIGLTGADTHKTEDGINYFTSDMLNNKLFAALAANATTVKNALEAAVKNGGVAMTETDATGHAYASDMEQGLYLIVETRVPENVTFTCNPFFVSLPMTTMDGTAWNYDVTVYPKNQTGNPTLDKTVREAKNSTGKNTGTLTDIQKPSCDPPKTSNHQGRDFRPSLGGCPAVCRNRGGLMPAG